MLKMKSKVVVIPMIAALSFGIGLGLAELTPIGRVTAQNTTVKTLNQLNEDFIQISEQVTPAVVSIAMTKRAKTPQKMDPYSDPDEFFDYFGVPNPNGQQNTQPQQGLGSGVIVDAAKGYILTNNHVVEGADEIRVTLADRRNFKATIVGTDPRSDLAVIQLQGASNLKQVTLGDADSLDVGEWVLAIGNPFGLDSTVTAGIISAKGRSQVGVADFEDFLQTDAAINPGNSGGALVNIKGELVGINTAIATRSRGYMGIGFAIPSNMAKQVMQSLIAKGKVSRSQLGVFIQPLDDSMAQGLGLANANQGILVAGVNKGSPAEKAGLKRYDVMTKLNGQVIKDSNHFRNTIALTPPNSQIEIEVLRQGKPMAFKIKLEAASPQTTAQNMNQAPSIVNDQDIAVSDLTPALRRQFQVAGNEGVLVTQVNPESPAFEKGLRPGDLVTELNQQHISNAQGFNTAYKAIKSGQTVLMAISRQDGSLVIAYKKP